MTKERLDKYLSIALIALGVMQILSSFRFFTGVDEPALWYISGGLLLMLVGALGLARLRYRAVAPGVATLSIIASVTLAIFWIALYFLLFDKFSRQPASFAGLVVVVAAAVMALLSSSRATRRP